MTVEHIVLFKKKADVASIDVPELQKGLDKLKKAIPGVYKITFGAQNEQIYKGYKSRSNGYTHALIATCKNADVLEKYAAHPVHVEFLDKHIKPNFELPAVIAIDYEHNVKCSGHRYGKLLFAAAAIGAAGFAAWKVLSNQPKKQ
jgi:hypothetical protein